MHIIPFTKYWSYWKRIIWKHTFDRAHHRDRVRVLQWRFWLLMNWVGLEMLGLLLIEIYWDLVLHHMIKRIINYEYWNTNLRTTYVHTYTTVHKFDRIIQKIRSFMGLSCNSRYLSKSLIGLHLHCLWCSAQLHRLLNLVKLSSWRIPGLTWVQRLHFVQVLE